MTPPNRKPRERWTMILSPRRLAQPLFFISIATLAGCSGAPSPTPTENVATTDEALDTAALAVVPEHAYRDVCAQTTLPGFARCHAKVRIESDGKVSHD